VLNASVHCEQKRRQRLSETAPANNRIPQAVREGIPDRRTSHTESPSAIAAAAAAALISVNSISQRNKKLSYRIEAARCLVLLSILISR